VRTALPQPSKSIMHIPERGTSPQVTPSPTFKVDHALTGTRSVAAGQALLTASRSCAPRPSGLAYERRGRASYRSRSLSWCTDSAWTRNLSTEIAILVVAADLFRSSPANWRLGDGLKHSARQFTLVSRSDPLTAPNLPSSLQPGRLC